MNIKKAKIHLTRKELDEVDMVLGYYEKGDIEYLKKYISKHRSSEIIGNIMSNLFMNLMSDTRNYNGVVNTYFSLHRFLVEEGVDIKDNGHSALRFAIQNKNFFGIGTVINLYKEQGIYDNGWILSCAIDGHSTSVMEYLLFTMEVDVNDFYDNKGTIHTLLDLYKYEHLVVYVRRVIRMYMDAGFDVTLYSKEIQEGFNKFLQDEYKLLDSYVNKCNIKNIKIAI